jgi:hypothetical protein
MSLPLDNLVLGFIVGICSIVLLITVAASSTPDEEESLRRKIRIARLKKQLRDLGGEDAVNQDHRGQ